MGALPPLKIEMEGLNTLAPATLSYPDSPDLLNVRWDEMGNLIKRTGYVAYCDTAQPDKSGGGAYDCEQVTGLFDFKKRDTTTRYTIVCTPTRIMLAPTTGAWTVLKSGISGPTATDYWDAAVFNNSLILTCPGAINPIITGGTAATTYDLTGGGVWQTLTTSGGRYSCGRLASTPVGLLWVDGYTGSAYSSTSLYDPISSSFAAVTSQPISKYLSAVSYMQGYERTYSGPGEDSGSVRTALNEYDHTADVWTTKKSSATARLEASAFTVNNRHYACGGIPGADIPMTSVEAYDPATDTWTTMPTALTVAKSAGAGFEIAEFGYITGGTTDGTTIVKTTYRYNPIADTWTAVTDVTTARQGISGAGSSASDVGLGYVVGGFTADSFTSETNKHESYNPISNAWASPTVLPTSQGQCASGIYDYWNYIFGGTTDGTTSVGTDYRYNISYSAPQAHYVENFSGYLFMARTATAPSRVYYSLPGDSAVWNPDAYFDVNADDGDWITGMFVFQGRLYVSKIGTLYQVYGTDFDPEEGDYGIQELPNIPGTVSNRSIVVTDHGVYYLAKDGFRLFDGAGSKIISTKIDPTIGGYVQSRNKAVAGIWNRSRSEIWWTMTSTGTTHDTIIVYNYAFDRWTKFTGMTASSIANVEDANDNSQILFGPASTTDGFIYKADSGETDNAGAINAYYKTGWFTHTAQIRDFGPRYLWVWVKRSGAWNLTVEYYTNHSTTATNSDTIALLSGTYPDAYFFDSTDQRARITVGSEENAHAMQVKFSNASASQPFEVYASVLESDDLIGGTYAP